MKEHANIDWKITFEYGSLYNKDGYRVLTSDYEEKFGKILLGKMESDQVTVVTILRNQPHDPGEPPCVRDVSSRAFYWFCTWIA